MARIDLKNATIRLIDGYANTAAVNKATPLNDDTNLNIDTLGVATLLRIGTRFTIVGSTRAYYVTSENGNDVQLVTVNATGGHYTLSFTGPEDAPIGVQTTASIAQSATAGDVQTALEALAAIVPGDVLVTGSVGGPYTVEFKGAYLNVDMALMTGTTIDLSGGADTVTVTSVFDGGFTHNIGFTPPLATADGIPVDDAVITFAGHTLEINVGTGVLDYNEKKAFSYELNRGRLDTVLEGDEQPVEVSLAFVWDFISAVAGSGVPTPEDAFKHRGEASTWVSSATEDSCAPYAVDVEVEYIPPCAGIQREIITLPDFRYESLDHSSKDALISVKGKCNATEAGVVRAA